MINYFNFREIENKYLITNDFGRHAFLTGHDLNCLIKDKIDYDSALGKELVEKRFLYNGSRQAFIQNNISLWRDSKSYIFNATSLHIVVVTNACNLSCIYCQANASEEKQHGMMDTTTAEKIVDVILESPNHHLTIEFQGGEPLLNYTVIKHIIETVSRADHKKDVRFSLVSNLTLLTSEMISFFAEYNVGISTSIDGDSALHDQNRHYPSGRGSFSDVSRSLTMLRKAGIIVGAIETTTRNTLGKYKEVIDTYCDLGFNTIFLRPMSPLGCAKQRWAEIGYSAGEFLAFYKQCLDYIIQKNIEGINIQENQAAIFLAKILHFDPVNYMELRSPCGAITGQMAYYYNGDVFTCDEGRMMYEMGDASFRLGTIRENSYQDLVNASVSGTVCKASILESIPCCCDCAYQPFCGMCPVLNLAIDHDILPKEPMNYRCAIHSGILDIIFSMLLDADDQVLRVLEGWQM